MDFNALDFSNWQAAVVSIVAIAVAVFLRPYLKTKTEEAKANRDAAIAQRQTGEITTVALITQEVKTFAIEEAANIAEKEFPRIAERILKDKMVDTGEVKKEIYKLRKKLYDRIGSTFAARGVDVLRVIGTDGLDSIIEWAANQVSPFPGKQTAKTLMEGGAKLLLDHGVSFLKGYSVGDEQQ